MQVSARVHYGCLAMLELAARYEQRRPVSLKEIVANHSMPQPFLVQILQSLRAAGLIQSTRGSNGGYQLSLPPREITILDIASAIGCGDGNVINESEPMGAHQEAVRQIWARADEAAREVLGQTTLTDLCEAFENQSAEMFYI